MKLLNRLDNLIGKYQVVRVFLLIFIFLQPFSRHATIRDGAFVLMTLAFLIRVARGGFRVNLLDTTVISFGLVVIASIVSSALSPYAAESFDAMRKNLLFQAIVFIVIICEYKGIDGLKPLIYAMLAGFAVLTAAILIKTPSHALLNWIEETKKGNELLTGYSLFATFYIPLAIGYLYSSREGLMVKIPITIFLLLESVFSVLNNHRGQTIAIFASALIITILAKRFKVLAVGLILIVLSAAYMYRVNPASFDRYETLLTSSNYSSDRHEGLNGRLSIWEGATEMIKDRPVTGWGYGWKKFSSVARERYMYKWDKSKFKYAYFSEHGHGSANPHNLALQVLFEIGFVGLIAFLLFWLTVLFKALAMYFGKYRGEATDFLKYGVLGVLVSYSLINIANGLWEEAYGILMVALAAAGAVLYREVKEARFRRAID
ncbi:MAG: O-antigen ligase family protein [Deltaproteobacteria bacterium]|nr:O-antigen ligase family protein [Deltaproteobacteria bacterium]